MRQHKVDGGGCVARKGERQRVPEAAVGRDAAHAMRIFGARREDEQRAAARRHLGCAAVGVLEDKLAAVKLAAGVAQVDERRVRKLAVRNRVDVQLRRARARE